MQLSTTKASPLAPGDSGVSHVALGIWAQTPANTMEPDTIDCIAAVRAVGNHGEHITGNAAKSTSEQTGKYNSEGTCRDHWRFWSVGVRARAVSPTQPMTETTKKDQ